MGRMKHRQTATGGYINTFLFIVQQLAGKRLLGTLAPENMKLLGRQKVFPYALGNGFQVFAASDVVSSLHNCHFILGGKIEASQHKGDGQRDYTCFNGRFKSCCHYADHLSVILMGHV